MSAQNLSFDQKISFTLIKTSQVIVISFVGVYLFCVLLAVLGFLQTTTSDTILSTFKEMSKGIIFFGVGNFLARRKSGHGDADENNSSSSLDISPSKMGEM